MPDQAIKLGKSNVKNVAYEIKVPATLAVSLAKPA